jgi:hypothetical protein
MAPPLEEDDLINRLPAMDEIAPERILNGR